MRALLGPWTPDAGKVGRGRLNDACNVVPRQEHYEPFYDLSTAGAVLDARGRGLAAYRDEASVVHIYAGDAAKLYARMSNGSWDNASKVGGYTSTESSRWRFTQFGDRALATNGQDNIQSITMSSGTDFADLAGSPPVAQHIATFGEFVVLFNVASSAFGYQWCSIGDSTAWVDGVNQASSGAFAEGGIGMGLVANATSLFFFQQTMIRRGLYTGGPLIIDIQPIEQSRGCAASGSIAALGQFIFFFSGDGFYQLTDAGAVPIGDGVIDDWFQTDSQADFYYRMSATIDPYRKLYLVAYASTSSVAGAPDTLLIYNWVARKWSYARLSVEVLSQIISLSMTLEDLDAIYGDLDSIPISLDDPLFSGGAVSLGAIGPDLKLGTFSGDALEATFETDDVLGSEQLVQFISGAMPMGDCAAAYLSVGARMKTADQTITWSTEKAMHPATGLCPARVNARYARLKLRIPAATAWTKMEAMEVLIGEEGDR